MRGHPKLIELADAAAGDVEALRLWAVTNVKIWIRQPREVGYFDAPGVLEPETVLR